MGRRHRRPRCRLLVRSELCRHARADACRDHCPGARARSGAGSRDQGEGQPRGLLRSAVPRSRQPRRPRTGDDDLVRPCEPQGGEGAYPGSADRRHRARALPRSGRRRPHVRSR